MSKSNSSVQLNLETPIIQAVSEFLDNKKLSNDPIISSDNSCTFKFDFHNQELGIYGEIYTCAFPLKPGHLRKIKSDILKLITYQQISQRTDLEKYLVLTITEDNLVKKGYVNLDFKIIPNKQSEFSLFGNKSWFNLTLKQFDIKILYYVLNDEENSLLKQTRNNQKSGNIAKN